MHDEYGTREGRRKENENNERNGRIGRPTKKKGERRGDNAKNVGWKERERVKMIAAHAWYQRKWRALMWRANADRKVRQERKTKSVQEQTR